MALSRASFFVTSFLVACSSESPPPPPPPPSPDVPSVVDVPAPDRPTTSADVPRDGATPGACGAAFGPMCNVVTNAGCGTGQACYLLPGILGTRARCTIAGGSSWGEPCRTATDCREGFICLSSTGACTKLCCAGDDASCRDRSQGGRDGARCAGSFNDIMGLQFCLDDTGCDPFATSNNGCPADAPRCLPIGDATTCTRTGQNCGSTTEGSPCCDSGCCPIGNVCVITGGSTCDPMRPSGACRRACNGSAAMPDSMCPMGQRCRVMFNETARLPSYFRACAP